MGHMFFRAFLCHAVISHDKSWTFLYTIAIKCIGGRTSLSICSATSIISFSSEVMNIPNGIPPAGWHIESLALSNNLGARPVHVRMYW